MAGARIQLKRATAAAWAAANTVLYSGEIGLETDTSKFKIGNGSTAFNSLSYFNGNLSGSSLNDLADVTITSAADGDFLRWNGTAWINDAVNLSTDTIGSYVASLVAGTGVTLTNNSGEGATPTVAVTANTFDAFGAASTAATNAATALTNHEADTTSIHGIADTSILVTTTGTQTLTNKTITSPSGLVKGDVGLGNVDNTADTAKPVSTAQQTAFDLKANLASPTFTGTVTVPTPIGDTTAATKLYVDTTASTTASNAATALTNHEADTTNIHGIADTSILVTTTGSQTLTNKTITAPSGLVKGDVGLGNADNTSDANKPVSTAGQTALDLKAPLASPTLTGTPIAPTATAGNNSTQIATTAYADAAVAAIIDSAPATLNTLNELADALGDDPSFATTVSTSIGLKAPIASPTFTGTVTIPTGASITAPTGLVKGDVGLGNTDNTSDANKPVSTAQQTALDLKAPLASPTFTGTVSGITATMVGLGSVNNTADTAKPVSTAQQTALDLKAPLASPSLTGTPLAPTATAGNNTTQIATTAFVATALSGASISALNDVADVTITSAANGDLLKWNGTAWVNAAGYALNTAVRDSLVQLYMEVI